MAAISTFDETRNIFISYTNYRRPLTYEQWHAAPQQHKLALLYVQFYPDIISAWSRANAYNFIPDEDGVSIVCQYLEKNVAKIDDDPKRFTASYIYRVAYNCMYCICHDIKGIKDRWDNEIPNITYSGGDEIDLFDTVASSKGSAEDVYEHESFEQRFWKVIEDAGLPAEKVLNYLLSGDAADLKKVSKRSKSWATDPLRDVSVSLDEVEAIIADLRVKLADLHAELA